VAFHSQASQSIAIMQYMIILYMLCRRPKRPILFTDDPGDLISVDTDPGDLISVDTDPRDLISVDPSTEKSSHFDHRGTSTSKHADIPTSLWNAGAWVHGVRKMVR